MITLQNGIDGVERLAPILGTGSAAAGPTRISVVVSEPGVVRHTGANANIICGPQGAAADPHLAALVDEMKRSGIDIRYTDAIAVEVWKKFVLLAAFSGLSAMTRKPIGAILGDSDARAAFIQLLEEAVAVGSAKGVRLDGDFVDQQIRHCSERMSPSAKASMLEDLERGKRLELDWMGGKVIALGHAMNVPVPMHAKVYAALAPYRFGS